MHMEKSKRTILHSVVTTTEIVADHFLLPFLGTELPLLAWVFSRSNSVDSCERLRAEISSCSFALDSCSALYSACNFASLSSYSCREQTINHKLPGSYMMPTFIRSGNTKVWNQLNVASLIFSFFVSVVLEFSIEGTAEAWPASKAAQCSKRKEEINKNTQQKQVTFL